MNSGYLEWVGAAECPENVTTEKAETQNEGLIRELYYQS